ncbi:hypothetical protein ACFQY7_05480 [Actinomadura luteofluorescens]|uniref:hypothetical protein n=1 Tax=Actinomadura luteofluorescens TaxID=46163 RepID=UPI00363E0698
MWSMIYPPTAHFVGPEMDLIRHIAKMVSLFVVTAGGTVKLTARMGMVQILVRLLGGTSLSLHAMEAAGRGIAADSRANIWMLDVGKIDVAPEPLAEWCEGYEDLLEELEYLASWWEGERPPVASFDVKINDWVG